MLSFVIPAYNEEALIGATIDALHLAAKSTGLPYEIVVANDASTDQTSTISRQHGARMVEVNKRQIAGTRNAGALAATGDVLVFVDADTIVPPDTLRAALKEMDLGAAGGGCAARFEGVVPLYAKVLLPILTVAFRWKRLACGCFIFCRREAFEATGGFDENLFASEELPMSLALKKQGRFVVLREHVITSGRKLRQNPASTLLMTLARMALTRRSKRCRNREGLELWYDGRREQQPPVSTMSNE